MYAHTQNQNDDKRADGLALARPSRLPDDPSAVHGGGEIGQFALEAQSESCASQNRLTQFLEPIVVGPPDLGRHQSLARKSPGQIVGEFRDELAHSIWTMLEFQQARPTDSVVSIGNAYIAASKVLNKIANQDLPTLLNTIADELVEFKGTTSIDKTVVKEYRERAVDIVHRNFAMIPISLPGVLRIDVIRKGPRHMQQLAKETLRRGAYTAATRFTMALIKAHENGLLGWVDVDGAGMLRAVTHRLRWVFECNHRQQSTNEIPFVENRLVRYRGIMKGSESGTVLRQRIQVRQELIEARAHLLDGFSQAMPDAARRVLRKVPSCIRNQVRIWEGTEIHHSILTCDEELEPYERVWEKVVYERIHVDPIIEIAGFAILGWSCHELKLGDRLVAMQTQGLRAARGVVRQIPAALHNSVTKSGATLRSSTVSRRVCRVMRQAQSKLANRLT